MNDRLTVSVRGANLKDPKAIAARREVERRKLALIFEKNEKVCPRCKLTLPLEAFYKCKGTATGRRSACVKCSILAVKAAHRQRHPKPRTEIDDERIAKILRDNAKPCEKCKRILPLDSFHRSKINRCGRMSYCKECRSVVAKEYNAQNYNYNRSRYLAHREERLAYNKAYSLTASGRSKQQANKYRYMRLPEVRKRRALRRAERYATDIKFRLAVNARARIRMAFKRYRHLFGSGVVVRGSKLDLLGCSMVDYKLYLEQQFLTGMTWDNHGSIWHIDHIVPINMFDLKDETQLKAAFNYKNTRPLWVADNLSRPKKINLSMPSDESSLSSSANKVGDVMSIIKTGEVRVNFTPCDMCGQPATLVVGSTARCPEHMDTKEATVVSSLKSFTEPLEEVADGCQ